ncbi:hypothetical protein [Treponema porcinum]|uniref:hypothetical protein n=1 Tax=Treponema porcinum TaxID=261392 RepID=UPI002A834743|nr:hypothetical protein [Treponema porcinum]
MPEKKTTVYESGLSGESRRILFLYFTAGGMVIVRSSGRKTYGNCIFDSDTLYF